MLQILRTQNLKIRKLRNIQDNIKEQSKIDLILFLKKISDFFAIFSIFLLIQFLQPWMNIYYDPNSNINLYRFRVILHSDGARAHD